MFTKSDANGSHITHRHHDLLSHSHYMWGYAFAIKATVKFIVVISFVHLVNAHDKNTSELFAAERLNVRIGFVFFLDISEKTPNGERIGFSETGGRKQSESAFTSSR